MIDPGIKTDRGFVLIELIFGWGENRELRTKKQINIKYIRW